MTLIYPFQNRIADTLPTYWAEKGLLTNLESHWQLNEVSGNALDFIGSNTLTDNNSVSSATGKFGLARDFESGSTQFLSLASNSSIETGDISFTFAAWVKAESFPGTFNIVLSKDDTGAREFSIYYAAGASNRFVGFVSATIGVTANSFGAATTGVWYFLVMWHDATTDILGISVNGVSDTVATGGALNAATSTEFRIGARKLAASPFYWDGLIESVSYWKGRALSAVDRANLYNGGSGRYIESKSNIILPFGQWWDSEASVPSSSGPWPHHLDNELSGNLQSLGL